MPSQHSKPVKEDESDYEDDKKSLTSIVKDNKKGPTNATNSTNSRLKLTRPKKEDDGDDHLPITSCLPSHPSESTLKKEDDVDDVSLGFLQKRKAAKANSGFQSKQARVKKEENDFDHGDDKSTVKKSSVPPNADKKKIEKEKTKVAAESSVKKEKKVSEQSVKKEKKLSEQSVKTQKKMSEQNGKNQKKVSEQILKGKKMSDQTVKKEKKVYALPGQKRDPPEERDPLRIFYETLYEQLPKSEMAQFWMMESGLLSEAEAKKVYEKKQKSKLQKTGTPKKATVSVERSTKSVTVKKQILSSPVSSNKKNTSNLKVAVKGSKKRSIEEESSENGESSEDESEDDFVMPNRKGKKQKVV